MSLPSHDERGHSDEGQCQEQRFREAAGVNLIPGPAPHDPFDPDKQEHLHDPHEKYVLGGGGVAKYKKMDSFILSFQFWWK